MKIPVKVSLLFDRDRGLEIAIECETSSTEFVEVTVAPENVCALMSRQVLIPGTANVRALDTVGKKMEVDKLEFELPSGTDYKNKKDVARSISLKVCPEGWKPDAYFGSHSSFFRKGDKEYASCTIRRYVDIESY